MATTTSIKDLGEVKPPQTPPRYYDGNGNGYMKIRTFRRLFPPAVPAEGSAFWLLFHGADLLMPADAAPTLLAGTAAALDGVKVGESFLLGTLDGQPLLVGVLPADAPAPAGYKALGLRGVLTHG